MGPSLARRVSDDATSKCGLFRITHSAISLKRKHRADHRSTWRVLTMQSRSSIKFK